MTTVTSVFAFVHVPCIYESAPSVISLHTTKAGAWRAMHAHQFKAWVEAQKECRHISKKEWREFCPESPSRPGKNSFWRKAYVHKRSYVQEMPVLAD